MIVAISTTITITFAIDITAIDMFHFQSGARSFSQRPAPEVQPNMNIQSSVGKSASLVSNERQQAPAANSADDWTEVCRDAYGVEMVLMVMGWGWR